MRRAVALLAFATLLAGCLAPGGTEAPAPAEDGARATPPVVVAVVDTGINPYHEKFRGGPTFEDVPGFPAEAPRVALSLDAADYDAAVAQDAAAWATVGEGQLVAFPGTRTAGISFGKGLPESDHLVIDDHGHGTAVADSVFEASPHVVVVALQIDDDERIADAMRWAAAQPWIDIVSISWGKAFPTEYVEETDMGLADAYRDAARAGKIIVNSAGNDPNPHAIDEHNGPPFVIAVGGASNWTKGEVRTAARFPDVIAAYTQVRAMPATMSETRAISGTSFSCPTVSGTLAEALWLVRDAVGATSGGTDAAGALVAATADGALDDGALTAAEVREAMNHRAELWSVADWQVPADERDLRQSNPIVFAAAQMGWGFVEPAQAPDIAALLLGLLELPPKSPEMRAFMQAREAARFALWGGA